MSIAILTGKESIPNEGRFELKTHGSGVEFQYLTSRLMDYDGEKLLEDNHLVTSLSKQFSASLAQENFPQLFLVGKNPSPKSEIGSHFGQTGDGLSGDMNSDGKVDIFDLVLVGSHFGESAVASAPSCHPEKQIDDAIDALEAMPNRSEGADIALKMLREILRFAQDDSISRRKFATT